MRRVIERCSLVVGESPLSSSLHKLVSCYFALVVDACLLLFLSQWVNAGCAEIGLLLDGLLLFTTAVAAASNTPLLLVPNLVVRALVLMCLLFFSCFALDALVRQDDSLQIWPELRRKIVENPQIAVVSIAFCILLIIEFRLFVRVWYLLTKVDEEVMRPPTPLDKTPPPYKLCLEDDALPKYEEVIRSSQPATHTVHPSQARVFFIEKVWSPV